MSFMYCAFQCTLNHNLQTSCMPRAWTQKYIQYTTQTMPTLPTNKEINVIHDFAATTIQSFWRMCLGKFYTRYVARQYYEKLLDQKRQAFYYYNNINGEASWYKPKFMGSDDFDLQENYDYYQSEQYMFSSYKINKYLNNVTSKEYANDEYDEYDDEMEQDSYTVYKIDDDKLECIDYNIQKEQTEEETAVQRLLRVEREQKQQEEEEKRETLRKMKEEQAIMLAEKKRKYLCMYGTSFKKILARRNIILNIIYTTHR